MRFWYQGVIFDSGREAIIVEEWVARSDASRACGRHSGAVLRHHSRS